MFEKIECRVCGETAEVQCNSEQYHMRLCYDCLEKVPYSDEEYKEAKQQGLDLDDWNDYERYFGLGEEPVYE